MYTVREVADFLKVDERTIRRWEREGHIAAVRLTTGTIRFTRESIKALMGADG